MRQKNGMRKTVFTVSVIILRHQNCPPTRYCMYCHLLSVYRRRVVFSGTYLTSNKGCAQLRSYSSPPCNFRAQ